MAETSRIQRFRVLGARVLVLPDPVAEVSDRGIVLPDQSKEIPNVGTVIETGVPSLQVGERVLFQKVAGVDVIVNGNQYILLSEKEVFGVFDVQAA